MLAVWFERGKRKIVFRTLYPYHPVGYWDKKKQLLTANWILCNAIQYAAVFTGTGFKVCSPKYHHFYSLFNYQPKNYVVRLQETHIGLKASLRQCANKIVQTAVVCFTTHIVKYWLWILSIIQNDITCVLLTLFSCNEKSFNLKTQILRCASQ